MKTAYWAINLIRSFYYILAILGAAGGGLYLLAGIGAGQIGVAIAGFVGVMVGVVTLLAIAEGIGLALDALNEIKTQTAIQKQLLATIKKRINGG